MHTFPNGKVFREERIHGQILGSPIMCQESLAAFYGSFFNSLQQTLLFFRRLSDRTTKHRLSSSNIRLTIQCRKQVTQTGIFTTMPSARSNPTREQEPASGIIQQHRSRGVNPELPCQRSIRIKL